MSSFVDAVMDFLAFRSFVSPYALIVFYYLGALAMPLATWGLLAWARRRLPALGRAYAIGRGWALDTLSPRQRALAIALFIGGFLFMELLWRMMFEYLIAYLQMRDALLELTRGLALS